MDLVSLLSQAAEAGRSACMLLLAIAGLSAREMVDASHLFDPRLFFGQDGSEILL